MERNKNVSHMANADEPNYCSEENPNQIQTSQNEDLQNTKVSSFRIIASQFVAICPIFFIKLRFGMGIGYTIVLIPELSKKNAEIDVTLDELTWFSSYCFLGPIACVSGGFVAQYAGVRQLLRFTFLLYILADLLFHWADNVAMILVAQAIIGFTGSISKLVSYTYMAEILQPKFRSITMAAMIVVVLSGRFFDILLGNFVHWRTQPLVSLVFPAIGFLLVHFIPDSPQWLANKNRLEDAAKSFARVRGWTTPDSVKAELYSSITNVSDSIFVTETTPESGSHTRRGTKLKKALSLYFDRSFYIPLLTMTAIFFFAEFNVGYGLTIFSGLIFEEIKSPIDGHIANIILAVLSIVSSVTYMFSIRFLGKRILTLSSIFIISICFIIAVILLYLTDSDQRASDTYSWIVSIVLLISYFAYYLGLGKVIYFLNSELFPHKLRYVGAGFGYFISEIMNASFSKIFLYIVKAITFPGTLIIFTIINVVSFIVIYFILPETEGVTLRKIEEHYAGTQNLKNKH